MAIYVKNQRAEELARQVAQATGTTITDAILQALEDKLARIQVTPVADVTTTAIMNISRRCSALPILDDRPEDEILGYTKRGY